MLPPGNMARPLPLRLAAAPPQEAPAADGAPMAGSLAMGLATGGVVILTVGILLMIALLIQRYRSQNHASPMVEDPIDDIESGLLSESEMESLTSEASSLDDEPLAQPAAQGSNASVDHGIFRRGRNTFFSVFGQRNQPHQHLEEDSDDEEGHEQQPGDEEDHEQQPGASQ